MTDCDAASPRAYLFRVWDAVEVSSLRGPVRSLVIALAKHADATGYGYWGHDKLAAGLGCSVRQIVTLMAEAESAGWVRRARHRSTVFAPGRTPNDYWVLIPEGAICSPSPEGANRASSEKRRKATEGANRARSVPKVQSTSPEGAIYVPEGAICSPDLPSGSTLRDLPEEDRARSARRGSESSVLEQVRKPEEASKENDGPAPAPVQKLKRQPKPKPERTDEQKDAHAATVAVYCSAFEAARGVKPPFGARDGAAVYALLDAVAWDVKRATAAIRNGLADGAWPADATIREIAANPARYATPPRMRLGGRGPVQPNATRGHSTNNRPHETVDEQLARVLRGQP